MKEQRDKILWMLQKNNLTQTWLIVMLAKKGFETSKTNLSDILRGVRKNDDVIVASLNLLDSYEEWVNGF